MNVIGDIRYSVGYITAVENGIRACRGIAKEEGKVIFVQCEGVGNSLPELGGRSCRSSAFGESSDC